MKEEWKKVHRHPFSKFYEVSDLGRVRRVAGKDCVGRTRPARLVTQFKAGGYVQVPLCADRQRWFALLHYLVASAFVGPCPGEYGRGAAKWQINHKNGNKIDNRPANLEWVTASLNQSHAVATGLRPVGNKHYRAKLTADSVLAIREAYAGGRRLCDLGRQYRVTEQNIFRIVNRKSWKHV